MADTKISALTALTDPAAGDLLAIVDDPSGTPATRKATLENVVLPDIRRYRASASEQYLFTRDGATTPDTGWSWVNQGASTMREANGALGIVGDAVSATHAVRALMRSVPSGTWELTARVRGHYGSTGPNYFGLCFSEGTTAATDEVTCVLERMNGDLHLLQFSNFNDGSPTSITSDTSLRWLQEMVWRVRKNASDWTDMDIEYSVGGSVFKAFDTARDWTASLAVPYTHWGFFIDCTDNIDGIVEIDVAWFE